MDDTVLSWMPGNPDGIWAGMGSAALSGSRLTVKTSSSVSAGPVGSSASMAHKLSDGLAGGTAQITATSSPKASFAVSSNYYVGVQANLYEDATIPTEMSLSFGYGSPAYAQVDFGIGHGGLTSVNVTLGVGEGFKYGVERYGAQKTLIREDVSPEGDIKTFVSPVITSIISP